MDDLFDVAIVGYGPVGQVLALLLGQRGCSVGVFEKQLDPYPLPRAVGFDHEVARILQGVGLGDELPELTEPADAYEWRNAAREMLLFIDAEGRSLSGWPQMSMFSQPALERVLDARVRTLPSIAVHRGAGVVALRPGPETVAFDVASPDGERREVRARWLVGCDGAKSFVREQLSIPVTDLGFFYDWLIVDVVPHERRTWTPMNWQLCDPLRPTTVVSGGPGRRRWEFMRLPGESVDDLNGEATAWRLLEPWGMTPETATLERHGVYTFQARWVTEWRQGRCLLAGDAAHQMPPFAGQGMCAGIRDAANLAWKLDLVLRGQALDAVLDTYTTERTPQVRRVIEFSMELGRIICVSDEAEAAERDATMIAKLKRTGSRPPLPSIGLGPGVHDPDDPRGGHLLLQGEVRHAETTGRFDDVVGRGFTLLSPSGDPASRLTPELAAFFASIGGISAHVAPGGPVDDVRRAYAQWFAECGVDVVLQRPDFHVFGTTSSIDGTQELVATLRSALGVQA